MAEMKPVTTFADQWQMLSFDIKYLVLSHYIDPLVDDFLSKDMKSCGCDDFDVPCDNCYNHIFWPVTLMRQIVQLQEMLPGLTNQIECLFRRGIQARAARNDREPSRKSFEFTISRNGDDVPNLDDFDEPDKVVEKTLRTKRSQYICCYVFNVLDKL